jgi:hypothetical protein
VGGGSNGGGMLSYLFKSEMSIQLDIYQLSGSCVHQCGIQGKDVGQ